MALLAPPSIVGDKSPLVDQKFSRTLVSKLHILNVVCGNQEGQSLRGSVGADSGQVF